MRKTWSCSNSWWATRIESGEAKVHESLFSNMLMLWTKSRLKWSRKFIREASREVLNKALSFQKSTKHKALTPLSLTSMWSETLMKNEGQESQGWTLQPDQYRTHGLTTPSLSTMISMIHWLMERLWGLALRPQMALWPEVTREEGSPRLILAWIWERVEIIWGPTGLVRVLMAGPVLEDALCVLLKIWTSLQRRSQAPRRDWSSSTEGQLRSTQLQEKTWMWVEVRIPYKASTGSRNLLNKLTNLFVLIIKMEEET